jgi:acylphosphatase
MKCLSIKVSGKVQGVFFRASTEDVAKQLGIKGFVRNEKGGSVYIEAEGDDEILKQFVDWCSQGPPQAFVEEIIINESPVQNFSKFEIKR